MALSIICVSAKYTDQNENEERYMSADMEDIQCVHSYVYKYMLLLNRAFYFFFVINLFIYLHITEVML